MSLNGASKELRDTRAALDDTRRELQQVAGGGGGGGGRVRGRVAQWWWLQAAVGRSGGGGEGGWRVGYHPAVGGAGCAPLGCRYRNGRARSWEGYTNPYQLLGAVRQAVASYLTWRNYLKWCLAICDLPSLASSPPPLTSSPSGPPQTRQEVWALEKQRADVASELDRTKQDLDYSEGELRTARVGWGWWFEERGGGVRGGGGGGCGVGVRARKGRKGEGRGGRSEGCGWTRWGMGKVCRNRCFSGE